MFFKNRLVEKKIVNFDDFENLDDLSCFIEQLLVVLNKSHSLLQSVSSASIHV